MVALLAILVMAVILGLVLPTSGPRISFFSALLSVGFGGAVFAVGTASFDAVPVFEGTGLDLAGASSLLALFFFGGLLGFILPALVKGDLEQNEGGTPSNPER